MKFLFPILFVSLFASSLATAQESSRPTFLLNGPAAKRDISSFAVRQLVDVGVSYSFDDYGDRYGAHAAYTYFLNDRFDIKAHGSVDYSDSTYSETKSAGFGTGVAFWPTANWSLTPAVSVRYQQSEVQVYAWWSGYSYSLDVTARLLTAGLTSEFSLPLGQDRWVIVTNTIAHQQHEFIEGLSGSLDFQRAQHLLGADVPIGGDAQTTYRIRATAGLLHDLNQIDYRDYSAAVSLRSSNTKTRVDGWKAGIAYRWAPNYFNRGYTTFSLSHQF